MVEMKNRNKLHKLEAIIRPDHSMTEGKIQDAGPGELSQSAFIHLIPAKIDD
jgi:hypothetical protein